MEAKPEVYLLQHVHNQDDGGESVKLIGIYSSIALAESAVERLSLMPGFREEPNGFIIDRYLLNTDQWAEGYITVSE